MASNKVVTAPLVVAKRADGSDVYLYEGAPVPDGLKDGEVERLADFLGDEGAESKAPARKSSSK